VIRARREETQEEIGRRKARYDRRMKQKISTGFSTDFGYKPEPKLMTAEELTAALHKWQVEHPVSERAADEIKSYSRMLEERTRKALLAEHHAAKVIEEKVYVAPVVAEVTSILQRCGFLHQGTQRAA
jgi:hypothetical protein